MWPPDSVKRPWPPGRNQVFDSMNLADNLDMFPNHFKDVNNVPESVRYTVATHYQEQMRKEMEAQAQAQAEAQVQGNANISGGTEDSVPSVASTLGSIPQSVIDKNTFSPPHSPQRQSVDAIVIQQPQVVSSANPDYVAFDPSIVSSVSTKDGEKKYIVLESHAGDFQQVEQDSSVDMNNNDKELPTGFEDISDDGTATEKRAIDYTVKKEMR